MINLKDTALYYKTSFFFNKTRLVLAHTKVVVLEQKLQRAQEKLSGLQYPQLPIYDNKGIQEPLKTPETKNEWKLSMLRF